MNFDERYILEKHIRELRSKKCFPIINRGKLWYDRLSDTQIGELREWYQAWLDAPVTLIAPDDLSWFNEKLNEEDYF